MKGFIASACVLIVSTGAAFGQWGDCGCCCGDISCPEHQDCFYASAEYLYWQIKPAPVPVPLVTTTTATPALTNLGALGQSGTVELFGNQNIGYPWLSGARATVGFQFPCSDCPVGIEGTGFYLPKRHEEFNFFSNGNGTPLIAEPFFNSGVNAFVFNASGPPGEAALVLSNPGGVFGGVHIDSSAQLWGSEANVVIGSGFSMLLGFRYVDLQEDLNISSTVTNLPGVNNLFNGILLGGGDTITVSDGFTTRNQFYGGQIGFRAAHCWGPFFIGAQAKIALGDTRESVVIAGNSMATSATGATIATSPGGLFAQPSNIGTYHRNEFAVVPEGEGRVGVNLGCHVTVYAGYNILYWSRVVRPGDQINRNINAAQLAAENFAATTPATQPSFSFKTTDFYTQGLTGGVEIRF
jgi:hypothetical protein